MPAEWSPALPKRRPGRQCLCLAFPLPPWLRQCLCLVFQMPPWLKALPLPCVSTAFAAKKLPLLAVLRSGALPRSTTLCWPRSTRHEALRWPPRLQRTRRQSHHRERRSSHRRRRRLRLRRQLRLPRWRSRRLQRWRHRRRRLTRRCAGCAGGSSAGRRRSLGTRLGPSCTGRTCLPARRRRPAVAAAHNLRWLGPFASQEAHCTAIRGD